MLRTLALRVVSFPSAQYRWAAAEDARREGRWTDVARLIESMHRTHWQNDNSHYLLGLACTNLGRYEDAVNEFEQISEKLDIDECEQARWLNHALSLSQIGRPRAALEILPPREDMATKFPDFAERAVQLHDDIVAFLEDSSGSLES